MMSPSLLRETPSTCTVAWSKAAKSDWNASTGCCGPQPPKARTMAAGEKAPSALALRMELRGMPRSHIGPFAGPDTIHWAPGLPKTRSGKIMRRVLRKIASNELDQLGDTSTLADPSVVDTLVDNIGK